jgi:hypothetical protein
MTEMISSSVKSKSSKMDRLYDNMSNSPLNKTVDRIEFIRLLLENTCLTSMFDMEHVVEKDYYKNVTNILQVFDKQTVNFHDMMRALGDYLVYIKSGTSGHTFKGMSIPDAQRPDMELNYAVKIVAYPKEEIYGDVNDASRPENAEILMLKVLSYFVVKRHTPHIVLPITTFNSNIKTFVALSKANLVKSAKYDKFIKRYEKGVFYDDVSVLISEWANGGDLLDYLRDKFKTLTIKEWRVIFFQIISTIATIQCKYPAFRHNDLKLNNILLQDITIGPRDGPFVYTVSDQTYYVPNIGKRCKIWDFDFACIAGIVENSKVNAEWTDDINVCSEAHQYYDIHYFFNTMISPGFIDGFFGRDDNGIPFVPDEVTEFVKRVVPSKLRTGKYVSKKGRLLIDFEQLKNVRGLFYKTPIQILETDPFFAKMRFQ